MCILFLADGPDSYAVHDAFSRLATGTPRGKHHQLIVEDAVPSVAGQAAAGLALSPVKRKRCWCVWLVKVGMRFKGLGIVICMAEDWVMAY